MRAALSRDIDDVIADPKTHADQQVCHQIGETYYGAHLCLGNALAKMDIHVLFTEMPRRIDDIRLAGAPAWVGASFVSGLKWLPVSYTIKADL